MKGKIKILSADYLTDAEWKINCFLKCTKGTLCDIKYLEGVEKTDGDFSFLITYTVEDEDEKEDGSRAEESEKSDGGIQRKVTPLWQQRGACCKV